MSPIQCVVPVFGGDDGGFVVPPVICGWALRAHDEGINRLHCLICAGL